MSPIFQTFRKRRRRLIVLLGIIIVVILIVAARGCGRRTPLQSQDGTTTAFAL